MLYRLWANAKPFLKETWASRDCEATWVLEPISMDTKGQLYMQLLNALNYTFKMFYCIQIMPQREKINLNNHSYANDSLLHFQPSQISFSSRFQNSNRLVPFVNFTNLWYSILQACHYLLEKEMVTHSSILA